MKFDVKMPGLKGAAYYNNGGYVKLEDRRGKEQTFLPDGFMLYACTKCNFSMYTKSNHGKLSCPICSNYKDNILTPLIQQWHKTQIVLVPEGESDFYLQYLHDEDTNPGHDPESDPQ